LPCAIIITVAIKPSVSGVQCIAPILERMQFAPKVRFNIINQLSNKNSTIGHVCLKTIFEIKE